MQALTLTDSSGQGRSAAHVSCIAERGPFALCWVYFLALQDGTRPPRAYIYVLADERSLLVGSRATPGPGSGSGPGSSGMALTTSGAVFALACSAGWLLALCFSAGSADSEQLVKPDKFCGVIRIAKAIVSCSLAGLALHVSCAKYIRYSCRTDGYAGRGNCAPCASRLAAMARIRSSSSSSPPEPQPAEECACCSSEFLGTSA